MPAYFIADIDVTDPVLFESYRPIAAASIAKHGGKYLVRGGALTPLEGGWTPKRVVILEFPSIEQAKTWYHSADYAEGLKMRAKATVSRVIMVEGMPPS